MDSVGPPGVQERSYSKGVCRMVQEQPQSRCQHGQPRCKHVMEFLHRQEEGSCPPFRGLGLAQLTPFQSAERLPMKFTKLVEHVSKKPILPHVKHLLVEVMLMDEEGEDVEVSHDIPLDSNPAPPSRRCHSCWYTSDGAQTREVYD